MILSWAHVENENESTFILSILPGPKVDPMHSLDLSGEHIESIRHAVYRSYMEQEYDFSGSINYLV